MSCCSVPLSRCSLPVSCCSVPVACCSVPVSCCSVPVACNIQQHATGKAKRNTDGVVVGESVVMTTMEVERAQIVNRVHRVQERADRLSHDGIDGLGGGDGTAQELVAVVGGVDDRGVDEQLE